MSESLHGCAVTLTCVGYPSLLSGNLETESSFTLTHDVVELQIMSVHKGVLS